MQKTINSEAMQPTRKPSFSRKSHIDKQPPATHHSTTHKVTALIFPDHIPQTTLNVGDSSPFKDHPLYSHTQDLASSFSYSEDQTQFQYQKLLFSKFLESRGDEWISFMHDMSKISPQNLLEVVNIGQSQRSVFLNRVLSHYIGVWLISMGYMDLQTRKRVILNVQYVFPEEQEAVGQIAGIMYQKMFQGYLPEVLQLNLLVEVCRRGWEYFSFFVANFIKCLKKYKSNKEELFLQEIQRIIKQ